MVKETYYQPKDCEWGVELYSFEVYTSKQKAQEDFPNTEIIEYHDEEIEEHTYVDC